MNRQSRRRRNARRGYLNPVVIVLTAAMVIVGYGATIQKARSLNAELATVQSGLQALKQREESFNEEVAYLREKRDDIELSLQAYLEDSGRKSNKGRSKPNPHETQTNLWLNPFDTGNMLRAETKSLDQEIRLLNWVANIGQTEARLLLNQAQLQSEIYYWQFTPPVLFGMLLITIFVFRKPIDRLLTPKSLSGHCALCDYNLTGNESGTCPECGSAITSPNHAEAAG